MMPSQFAICKIFIAICLLMAFCFADPCAAESCSGLWALHGQLPYKADGALSPDGQKMIKNTPSGLVFIDLRSHRKQLLSVWADPPLEEVVWSANSQFFAINSSSGGLIGEWNTILFKQDHGRPIIKMDVSKLVRAAARDFAKCDENEEPEVGVIGFDSAARHMLVVAEVPNHSSCKNLGELQGFLVSIGTGEILERLPESAVKKKWVKHLCPRFPS